MIFPQNVYHSVSGSGGMTDADKNRFYAQMIVFFGSIFLLGACWICYKYLHISPWFAFLGGLVIVVLVGISFFRFVVFDEQSKIHEYRVLIILRSMFRCGKGQLPYLRSMDSRFLFLNFSAAIIFVCFSFGTGVMILQRLRIRSF